MSWEMVRVDRTTAVSRFKDVVCDGCGAGFQHALGQHGVDDDGLWKNIQPQDALQINLVGGYGMYFDPSVSADPVFFCKACADKLCDQWPVFKSRIEVTSDDL